MISRRSFIQRSSLTAMTVSLGNISEILKMDLFFSYESPYLKLQLLRERPEFSFFSTDSLGGGRFSVNPILKNSMPPDIQYESRTTSKSIAYFFKTEK